MADSPGSPRDLLHRLQRVARPFLLAAGAEPGGFCCPLLIGETVGGSPGQDNREAPWRWNIAVYTHFRAPDHARLIAVRAELIHALAAVCRSVSLPAGFCAVQTTAWDGRIESVGGSELPLPPHRREDWRLGSLSAERAFEGFCLDRAGGGGRRTASILRAAALIPEGGERVSWIEGDPSRSGLSAHQALELRLCRLPQHHQVGPRQPLDPGTCRVGIAARSGRIATFSAFEIAPGRETAGLLAQPKRFLLPAEPSAPPPRPGADSAVDPRLAPPADSPPRP